MKYPSILVAAGVLFGLSGCVTEPKADYAKFFDHQPRSILVVPPANKTTAVDAPHVFLTTISTAFAERGYYVFPVFLVHDILTDLGATDEGAITAIPPEKLKEVFGADSILYVTITDWATSYVVLASNITVGAEYRLVDASSGEQLWTHKERVVHNSGGAGGGGGLIGALVAATVNAAVTAATVQYRPVAFQTNNLAVVRQSSGLPFGPYHPEFQKDHHHYQ
jgi:hypothetical protein